MTKSRVQEKTNEEAIAIVGIGVRFPAGSDDVTSFWNNLVNGKDCITEVEAERWSRDAHYSSIKSKKGKSISKWGGFVSDVKKFDNNLFGISPREAENMDPQQRMLLEVSWQAMENAGIVPDELRGSNTGVFIGGFTLDYMLMQLGTEDYRQIEPHAATGSMMTLLSNRLSYTYDFKGPSLSVDTACSSSLVALHLAVKSLLAKETDLALVGGVNAMLTPGYFIAETQAGMLSPTGRSRAFDGAADGYVRGEGAGVIVLKPLSSAIKDGDRVYATILATGVNQDGFSNGITVPNGQAQEALIRETYQKAGVDPSTAIFVEAHGTGTPIGDPIEANAIGRAVGESHGRTQPCYLSAVKTNIGHTEAAAGIAGVIKASLAIYHKTLPRHLHLNSVNEQIDLKKLNLKIAAENVKLDYPGDKIIASVNSFGFGGTNGHVILQGVEHQALVGNNANPSANTQSLATYIVPISAASKLSLSKKAENFSHLISDEMSETELAELIKQMCCKQSHLNHRAAIVTKNSAHFKQQLDQLASDETGLIAFNSLSKNFERKKLAWVLTGMGAQWWGMGHQLYKQEDIFKQEIDRVSKQFEKLSGWSLSDAMLQDEANSKMKETQLAQPANFAIQLALAKLWSLMGIVPDAIIGHSAGEPAACYLAGVLSFEDAVDVIYYRSHIQHRTAGQGSMVALGMNEVQAKQLIAKIDPEKLSIAAINSSSSLTLSGDNDCIDKVLNLLEGGEIFYRKLAVEVPFHSHYLDLHREDFYRSFAHIKPKSALIPLYSTVTGGRVDGKDMNNEYWCNNVRNPVQFYLALKSLLKDDSYNFLEIGPQPVLATSIKEVLGQENLTGECWASLRKNSDELEVLFDNVAKMYCAGYTFSWNNIYSRINNSRRELPCYPWDRQEFWFNSPVKDNYRTSSNLSPFLGRRLDSNTATWEVNLDHHSLLFLTSHKIQSSVVFPGAGYIEMATEAAIQLYGVDTAFEMKDIQFKKALFIDDNQPLTLRITIEESSGRFSVASRGVFSQVTEWTEHASGRVWLCRSAKKFHATIEQLKKDCNHPISQQECYRHFAKLGLVYEKAFQGLEALWQGDRQAFSKIELHESLNESFADFRIHPVVIDLCFQTLAAALPFTGDDEESNVYMPVAVSKGKILRKLEPQMYVHATITQQDKNGLKGDIWLLNSQGEVIVEIIDCLANSLSDKAGFGNKPQQIYNTQWFEQALEVSSPLMTEKELYLIFSDNNDLEQALTKNLQHKDRQLIYVHAGSGFSVNDQVIEIDPATEQDYERLLKVIKADESLAPLKSIIYAWPSHCVLKNDADTIELEKSNEKLCLGLMYLLQGLASIEFPHNPKVSVLTQFAQNVVEDDAIHINPIQATVWGMSKIAGQIEHKQQWSVIVDSDFEDMDRDINHFITEIQQADISQSSKEDMVAFRQGKRYVPRLTCVDEIKLSMLPTFKSDVTYLITGGLGALGFLTSEWMVKRGARHLLLLGRSALPDRDDWQSVSRQDKDYEKIQQVLALEKLGASVTYSCVDINDIGQLTDCIHAYESRSKPTISGVIHTAGLAVPKLILEMTQQDLEVIMQPKQTGSWNLHQVFRARELDLFVLFSSIASVIGSTGQANYAAGNSFLDALATKRRAEGLGGISLNWGPWGEVGMATQLDLLTYFNERGFTPMTNKQGLDMLGYLLGDQTSQATIVGADWIVVGDRNFPMGESPALLSDLIKEASQKETHSGDRDSNIFDFLTQYQVISEKPAKISAITDHLKTLTAKVLRIDLDKIEANNTLSTLGLDSMMAIELKAYIEKSLKINIAIVELLKGEPIEHLALRLFSELDEREQPVDMQVEDLLEAIKGMSQEEALRYLTESTHLDTETV